MSAMVEVGRSLDPSTTLEAQSRRDKATRRHRREHVCGTCGEYPYPRGFCLATGLCWFCMFPRPS